MTHRKDLELELIRDVPGYRVILKAVLKSQIAYLMEQLSDLAGEETLLLAACIEDGTVCQLGSEHGRGFLSRRDEIKGEFIRHCVQGQQQTMITGRQSRNDSVSNNENKSDQSKISRRKTSRQKRTPYAKNSAVTLKASKRNHSSNSNLDVIPNVTRDLPETLQDNMDDSHKDLGKAVKRRKRAKLDCNKAKITAETWTQSVIENQSDNHTKAQTDTGSQSAIYTGTQSATGNNPVNRKQRKSLTQVRGDKLFQGIGQTQDSKLDEINSSKDNDGLHDDDDVEDMAIGDVGDTEDSNIVADDDCDDAGSERGMVRESQTMADDGDADGVTDDDDADISDGVADEEYHHASVIVDSSVKIDHVNKPGVDRTVGDDRVVDADLCGIQQSEDMGNLRGMQQSSEDKGDHPDSVVKVETENDDGRNDDQDQSAQSSSRGRKRMGHALPDTLRASIVYEIVQQGGNAETGEFPRGVMARVSQMFHVHATSVSRIWENYVLNRTISPRQQARKQ